MASQADLALQAFQGAPHPLQSAPQAAPQPQSQADAAMAAIRNPGSAAAPGQAAGAPTGGGPMGAPWSWSDLATATGHHLLKFADGTGQLVENAAAKGASLLPDNPVSRAIIAQNEKDNQQSSNWENGYQAAVPNGPAASLGAVAGEVAPFLLEAPVRGLQLVGDGARALAARVLPAWAQRAGGATASAAAQGATVAATQPVTQDPTTMADLVTGNTPAPVDYWGEKGQQVGVGAAGGVIAPALGNSAGAIYRGGKNLAGTLLNPSGYAARNIAGQLGDTAPQVIDALKNAPTFVPGSTPTAAQAAGGSRMVMMEKALANANPEFKARLADLENSNNAARLQAVGNVAQTPEALQAAIDSRNAQTAPMRDFTVTNGNPVPVAPVQGALSSLANGSMGVRPTIGGAASGMRSAVDGFTNVTPPNTLTNVPGSATAHPAMLDALRQNANDYLSKYSPGGFAGTQEQAAMMPVKGSIIDAINEANPGHKVSPGGWGRGMPQQGPEAPSYRDYLQAFAQNSVPVNTMEVGQTLQKTLMDKALNSDKDPGVTLTNYQGALSRALKGSDYAIDPQAQAALEAVKSDLQRSTVSNSIRAPGSDTAYNSGAGSAFLRALGAGSPSNVVPGIAGAGAAMATGSATAGVGAAMGAKKASGFLANRVGNAMGDLFLDPQELAKALQAAGKPSTSLLPSQVRRIPSSALGAALLLQMQPQQTQQQVQQ